MTARDAPIFCRLTSYSAMTDGRMAANSNEGGIIGASAEFAGKESLFRSALDHLENYDYCPRTLHGETQIDNLLWRWAVQRSSPAHSIPNSFTSFAHLLSTSVLVLASMTISSGQGRMKPSLAHLRVASMPIFEP